MFSVGAFATHDFTDVATSDFFRDDVHWLYRELTNGDLKVAHCSNVVCTTAMTTTADSAGDVGWCTSATIGADGLPLISHYDDTNVHLRIAHCSNAFCIPNHRRR